LKVTALLLGIGSFFHGLRCCSAAAHLATM